MRRRPPRSTRTYTPVPYTTLFRSVLGFDHGTGAADDQRGVLVGHRQQRLELSEAALGAPVLGQFHRGARELAVLFELGFEQLEQRERIGRRAGKTGQHLAVLAQARSEEHTSELQSLMRISYAVFCLKKKNNSTEQTCK